MLRLPTLDDAFSTGLAEGKLANLPSASRDLRVRLVDHGVVDVRPVHERDAPPGHGERRVQPRRLAERALGLVVVEGEGPHEALVERLLRRGDLRRHLAAVASQVVRTPRGRRIPGSGHGMHCGGGGGEEKKSEGRRYEVPFHGLDPPARRRSGLEVFLRTRTVARILTSVTRQMELRGIYFR
jgi:hypothetical protein